MPDPIPAEEAIVLTQRHFEKEGLDTETLSEQDDLRFWQTYGKYRRGELTAKAEA